MAAGRRGDRGGLLFGERQVGAEVGTGAGRGAAGGGLRGLPVAEYAPLKIKSSVVGYGLAKKEQVQFMVARLLELTEPPEPPDAADALAIAICHIHTAQTLAVAGGWTMKGLAAFWPWPLAGGAGELTRRASIAGRLFQPWPFSVALDPHPHPGWTAAISIRSEARPPARQPRARCAQLDRDVQCERGFTAHVFQLARGTVPQRGAAKAT